MEKVTIFFDGACPLCRREIALMRRLDRKARLAFEDVSDPGAPLSCPLSREELLARFHARLPGGEMVSGARAFTEAYAEVPGLGFLRPLGRNRATRWLLDRAYLLFLKVRPLLQRLVPA